jgi:hypothetical protein
MHVTVTQKNTSSGAVLKFVGIVQSQVWPTRTSKNLKTGVMRGYIDEFVDGCIIGEQLGGGAVYEVGVIKESLVSIFQWYGSMSKKGETHLHNVAMFMLHCTILLMRMGAPDLMRDANILEKGIKFLILPTPVRLNSNDLTIKHALSFWNSRKYSKTSYL